MFFCGKPCTLHATPQHWLAHRSLRANLGVVEGFALTRRLYTIQANLAGGGIVELGAGRGHTSVSTTKQILMFSIPVSGSLVMLPHPLYLGWRIFALAPPSRIVRLELALARRRLSSCRLVAAAWRTLRPGARLLPCTCAARHLPAPCRHRSQLQLA